MPIQDTTDSPLRGRASPPLAARKNVAPSKAVVPDRKGVKVTHSIVVNRRPAPLYVFWRNLENLPAVIKHPVTIENLSPLESHWSVSAPLGDGHVEWDALIINDEPHRLIAWRSRQDSEILNAGTVRFEPVAPGAEATKVTVTLEYVPPGGRLAALLAKLSGEEAGQQVAAALRRFKELMETTEMPVAADLVSLSPAPRIQTP